MTLASLFSRLLSAPVAPTGAEPPFDRALEGALRAGADADGAWDRAIIGGAHAPNLSVAFAVGYQAALDALFGRSTSLRALAVTEPAGNRPRDIQTTLTPTNAGYRLEGQKSFVTLGQRATEIFVAARAGLGTDGRPALRIARIDTSATGVLVQQGARLPIVPEVEHAAVRFEHVQVPAADVLTGDGYAAYVKPFRTVEDIYVHLTLLSHLLQLTRHHAIDASVAADAWASMVTLRALAQEDPGALSTHVALAGVLSGLEGLLTRFTERAQHLPAAVQKATERDLALRHVARAARQQRWANAAAALAQPAETLPRSAADS